LAYIVPFDDNINFHKVSNIHHVRPATNILSTQLKVTIYHIIYKLFKLSLFEIDFLFCNNFMHLVDKLILLLAINLLFCIGNIFSSYYLPRILSPPRHQRKKKIAA
jgi:hypothetical protein